MNFLPENSRRLKALPVWFSLKAYGKKGITEMIDNNIKGALLFGNCVAESDAFELLAPVRLNTVCFSLKGTENQSNVTSFLNQLNDTGFVFMTPTVYQEKKGIRAAFVNWLTTEDDIIMVYGLMVDLMKKINSK